MVDEGYEGDGDHAENLSRCANRGRTIQFWMDGSFPGCPSGLLPSFGCKIRKLDRAGSDLSQADVFTERRGHAQGVQCFQPKGSSRCTSFSYVSGLSVWTSSHTRVLKKFPSPKLKAILVWEPMRGGDDATSATQQAETVQDIRISQGWDGGQNLGKLFGQTLDLHQIAWDVYLVYIPGIKWEGTQPPRPTFWMHQLEGADPKLLLCENPTRINAEVGKLLDQMD